MIRETLDLLAMFALFVSIIALAGMLLHTKRYAELRMECCEPFTTKKSGTFWLAAVLLIVSTMIAEYFVATKGPCWDSRVNS